MSDSEDAGESERDSIRRDDDLRSSRNNPLKMYRRRRYQSVCRRATDGRLRRNQQHFSDAVSHLKRGSVRPKVGPSITPFRKAIKTPFMMATI